MATISIERTALSIHFNQECSHCDLAGGYSQIKKENRDPSKEQEVVQLADLCNGWDMVSQAVEHGYDTTDLSNGREELFIVNIDTQAGPPLILIDSMWE